MAAILSATMSPRWTRSLNSTAMTSRGRALTKVLRHLASVGRSVSHPARDMVVADRVSGPQETRHAAVCGEVEF